MIRTTEGRYKLATVTVLGLWLLFCVATLGYNGPFFDESIYIVAGQRTLEGHGLADGYLTWFAGSLLWPVLAALGYQAGGLIGARAYALGFAGVAVLATVQTARNLFGIKAAFWTAVVLATSGALLALARLGVLDLPALAGLAVSLWAVTELAQRDHRRWLIVISAGLALAIVSKYPMGLMALPLAGVVLALRADKGRLDLLLLSMLTLAVTVTVFLPMRQQAQQFLAWRVANSPSFGITPAMAWFSRLYWLGAPVMLALAGWFMAAKRRLLATVLLLGLAIWPAFHMLAGDPISENKHIVSGLLFAGPLMGLALSRIAGWRKGVGRAASAVIAAGLLVLGLIQVQRANQAWPDLRRAAGYLAAQVQPGERLLINESWPYTLYLYIQRRIDGPWDVIDAYGVASAESAVDVCQYDWFVDTRGSFKWPEPVLQAVADCGSYRPVYTETVMVMGLGPDLRFVRYPVKTTIWRNSVRR